MPPKIIEARHACPPLPSSIKNEIGKRTNIPLGEMKKSEVMYLIRKYGTSEYRKDQKLKQLANMYERCRKVWF